MSTRRWPALQVAALALVAGLALGGWGPADDGPSRETVAGMDEDAGAGEGGGALPAAHPDFAAYFTDPRYEDQADELAPFGSDEGWDLLADWGDRRGELGDDSTLRDVLADSEMEFALDELDAPAETSPVREPGGRVDASVITVGAGFTLLRLTGQIDAEGRELTLTALDNLVDEFPDEPGLRRQREDLVAYPTG